MFKALLLTKTESGAPHCAVTELDDAQLPAGVTPKDAVLALIQTNTTLTLHGGDTLLTRDKLIYSGFSESGYDLWNVGAALGEHLKAIVAVEPQNLNSVQNDYRPRKKVDGGNAAEGETAPKPERVGPPPAVGKDVIPGLLKRGVKIYIIGLLRLEEIDF